MEFVRILEENGFSKSEAMVYLTLLKTGRTKSGEIIRKTGLQSSVVHNSLNGLLEKGFINYILVGKIKHYEASNPDLIADYIEKKKMEYEVVLPDLKSLYVSKDKGEVSAEIYQGYRGLFAAVLGLIKDAKKGEFYKYFSGDEEFISEESLEFFKKSDAVKDSRGIVTKGITNVNSKEKLVHYKASEIKYVERKIPSSTSIVGDNILFITFGDKPISILIKSKEMARQYSDMWDEIWKE